MDFEKKIKFALVTSMALLVVGLLFAFINMRIAIADSNKETLVLRMINNIEAVQLNVENLVHIKNVYLKTGNENYLKDYPIVSSKIKENKNELLDYSIKYNYKKDDILLLANIAARNISNNNTILDIKKYNDSSQTEIPFFDSFGNRQKDSVIILSGRLKKDALDVFKNTTAQRQKANTQQILLYFLLAVIFFTSLFFTYFYVKANLKKAKNLNRLLLYNSTLLKKIYTMLLLPQIATSLLQTGTYMRRASMGTVLKRQKENLY